MNLMKTIKQQIRILFMIINAIFLAIGYMMIFIGTSAYVYPSGFISDFNTFFNCNIKIEIEKHLHQKRRPPRSLFDNCDAAKHITAGFIARRLLHYKDDASWRMDDNAIYLPMSYNMYITPIDDEHEDYWQSDFESQDQVVDRFPKLNTILSIDFGGAGYTTIDYWKIAEGLHLSNNSESEKSEVIENATNNGHKENKKKGKATQRQEKNPVKSFLQTRARKSRRMKGFTKDKVSKMMQHLRANVSVLSCSLKVLKLEDSSSMFWTYLIVLGALIVCISVEGLLAAISFSLLHRAAYSVSLTMFLFLAVFFIISILLKLTYLKHNTAQYLISLLRDTYTVENTVETVIWNALMIYFNCCGVTGYANFKDTQWEKNHIKVLYPVVCCSGINITENIVKVSSYCSLSKQHWAKKNGCVDEITKSIKEHGFFYSFLSMILLVALVLAFYNTLWLICGRCCPSDEAKMCRFSSIRSANLMNSLREEPERPYSVEFKIYDATEGGFESSNPGRRKLESRQSRLSHNTRPC